MAWRDYPIQMVDAVQWLIRPVRKFRRARKTHRSYLCVRQIRNSLWLEGPCKTQPWREICLVREAAIIVPPQPEIQTHVPKKLPVVLNEGAVVIVPQSNVILLRRDTTLFIQKIQASIYGSECRQVPACCEQLLQKVVGKEFVSQTALLCTGRLSAASSLDDRKSWDR